MKRAQNTTITRDFYRQSLVNGISTTFNDESIDSHAYDDIGNVTRYIDESGNVVAAYEYDDFGKTISQTGTMADIFRHRFSTKYFDVETGLYYYGYRFYSTSLMRWLNRDPIEEDGGLNLYGFCGNAAIYSHDSQGLQVTFDIKITPIRVGIILSTKNHKSSYPRAATSHGGDLKFSCDKDCRIKVSGKLSLKIEMLDRGNIRWNKSFPQYRDSAFVSEDLNTYNHELDHFYTWNDFYAFLKTANSYDGRFYKDCNAKALDLQIRYSRFKSKVQQHSSSFDQDGRNMGGQYSRHPLDMSKFNWE